MAEFRACVRRERLMSSCVSDMWIRLHVCKQSPAVHESPWREPSRHATCTATAVTAQPPAHETVLGKHYLSACNLLQL